MSFKWERFVCVCVCVCVYTVAFLHVDQSGQIEPGCGLDPDVTERLKSRFAPAPLRSPSWLARWHRALRTERELAA